MKSIVVLAAMLPACHPSLTDQTPLERLVRSGPELNLLATLTRKQEAAVTILLTGFYLAGLHDAVQESSIDGEFEGWDGETVVRLIDGTDFQQTDYHYYYTYSYSPAVIVLTQPFGHQILVSDAFQPETVAVQLSRISRTEALKRLLVLCTAKRATTCFLSRSFTLTIAVFPNHSRPCLQLLSPVLFRPKPPKLGRKQRGRRRRKSYLPRSLRRRKPQPLSLEVAKDIWKVCG